MLPCIQATLNPAELGARNGNEGALACKRTDLANAFGQHLQAANRTQTVNRTQATNQRAEVRPDRTPLSFSEASQAIRRGWTEVFGEPPSRPTLSILTAQWAHETGRGSRMYNNNFGGIKGVGPSGLTVACRTREGSGTNERTLTDHFRAYRTPEEGATDYVRVLASRYRPALESAKSGDPEGFVRALKSRGYFTGDEAAYTASVARLAGMSGVETAASAPAGEISGAARTLRAPVATPNASTQTSRESQEPTELDALLMQRVAVELERLRSDTRAADASLMAEQLARAALEIGKHGSDRD
jgi:hypothetical protein